MNTNTQTKPNPPIAPMAIVGAILAQGAIRLLKRQRQEVRLDNLTEESVSTGVLTNQESTYV